MKQAFSKQITGNVIWIVRVYRSLCRQDSREYRTTTQSNTVNANRGIFLNKTFRRKSIEIVSMNSIVCVDKIVDYTEQLLKAR